MSSGNATSSSQPIEFLNPARKWRLGHKGQLKNVDVSGVVNISGELYSDNTTTGTLIVQKQSIFNGTTYRELDTDLSYINENGAIGLAKNSLPKQNDYTSKQLITNSSSASYKGQVLPNGLPKSLARAPEIGRTMVVGMTGYYGSSDDGIVWDISGERSLDNLRHVIWVKEHNQFVMVGDSGYVAVSSDSKVIDASAVIPDVNVLYSIAYSHNLNLYVLAGADSTTKGFYCHSTDGLVWGSKIYPDITGFPIEVSTSIIWVPEIKRFVSVGASFPNNGFTRNPFYAASKDGIVWDISGLIPTNQTGSQLMSVSWSRELGRISAVGLQGFYASGRMDDNDIYWDSSGNIVGIDKFNEVIWASHLQRFIAVATDGIKGKYYSSLDGAIWDISGDLPTPGVSVCWQEDLGSLLLCDSVGSVFYTDPKYRFQTTKNLFEDVTLNNMTVTADASFQANVDISGRLTTNTFTVNKDVSFNANVDISDNLNINGNIVGTGTASFGTITTTGRIHGPEILIIDPAEIGTGEGLVIIKGSLQVDGTNTVINSLTLDISDHRILLASNANNVFQTHGAGLEVSGGVFFTYEDGGVLDDYWEANVGISAGVMYTTLLTADTIDTEHVNIAQELYVGGDASFNQDVEITGTLYGSKLIMTGDSSFNGKLNVSDTLHAMGDAKFDQKVDISENLFVNGDVSFQRGLDVSGKLFATSMVTTSLKVVGDVSFINGINIEQITGDISFERNVDISENLYVNGDVSFQRNVDVSGKLVPTDLRVIRGASFEEFVDVSNLRVGNLFPRADGTNGSLAYSTSSTILGNMVCGYMGSSQEDNEVGFKHRHLIGSNQYSIKQNSSGKTEINGASNQGIHFNISDVTHARLSVAGNFGIGMLNPLSKFVVTGDSSFNGGVDISDNLNVGGDTSLNNNLIVGGDTSLNHFVDISNLRVGDGYGRNNGSASDNTNSSSQTLLGNMLCGYVGFDQFVGIKHRNLTSNNQYALIQNGAGSTLINAANGQNMNFNINNTVKMRLTSDGNFGVGLLNPNSRLEVLGDTSLNGNVDISDELYVNGDVSFQRNLDVSGDIVARSIGVQQLIAVDASYTNIDVANDLNVGNETRFTKKVYFADFLDASNLMVGPVGTGPTTYQGIKHREVGSNLGYAVAQNAVGRTVVNALSPQPIEFRQSALLMGVFKAGLFGIGTAFPSHELEVVGDCLLHNDVDISNELIVGGNTTLNNNVDISENLYVNGDVSFQRNLDVSGRLLIDNVDVLAFRDEFAVLNGKTNIVVAVGIDNTTTHSIAYSYDLGVTWTPATSSLGIFSDTGTGGQGIHYNGSIWVAVGRGTNSIAYSKDGINWTGVGSSIFLHSGRAVKYDSKNTKWIATGQGGNTFAQSYDGILWEGLGNNSQVDGKVMALDFNSTMYVACGEGTRQLAYSSDLITWTSVVPSPYQRGRGVVWTGRNWVTSGSKGTGTGTIFHSDDGITWVESLNASNLSQASATVLATVGNAVACNGSVVVVVGKGINRMAYSTDFGVSFTGVTGGLTSDGYSIEWCGTHWVAGGNGNQIVRSIDGITWTSASGTIPISPWSIAWNRSIYGTLANISEQLSVVSATTSPTDISYSNVDISTKLIVDGTSDLKGTTTLHSNLLTSGAAVKIPITYNMFAVAKGAGLTDSLTSVHETWHDASADGYTVQITPMSANSAIKIEFKVAYVCGRNSGQRISFRVKNNLGAVIFTDELLGMDIGIPFNSVYSGVYVDTTGYSGAVTYHLEYNLENNQNNNIVAPSGIVGSNSSYITQPGLLTITTPRDNIMMLQELYIP